MSEPTSLRERAIADLSSTNTLVTIIAVLFVIPILAYLSIQGTSFMVGFLLIASVCVNVPSVHRIWPVEYAARRAVVWTIIAGLLTGVFYISMFQLFAPILETEITVGVAFIITSIAQFAVAIVYRRF